MSKDKQAKPQVSKAHHVSKGQRRSGGAIKAAIIKPVDGNLNTAMREAFLATELTDSVRYSRLGNLCIKAVQHEPKITREQEKGYSTSLSFRTFKALQAQGVLA